MYFKNFPIIEYSFGDHENPVLFQNITSYADIIDQVKDNLAFYEVYTIKENERPDALSYEFYGTIEYYWTFEFMNDHIKEYGWPLNRKALSEKIMEEFSRTVITSRQDLATSGLKEGIEITGLTSTATGTVYSINYELGQIVIDTEDTFRNGEIIQFTVDGETVQIQTVSVMPEYNATHHFEDSEGNPVDLMDAKYDSDGELIGFGYPFTTLQPALYTEVTNMDMMIRKNEEQREIVIIKPDVIGSLVSQFFNIVKG